MSIRRDAGRCLPSSIRPADAGAASWLDRVRLVHPVRSLGFETAKDADVYEIKRKALIEKFSRVEAELGSGPFFAGERFSLVDAVFAPIFRYFDLFDAIATTDIFAHAPKVRLWRTALAARPSVVGAVTEDYRERLREFLIAHDARLLKLAA